MRFYTYDGPVLEFERIVAEHWLGFTYATSEKKARSNLAHKFKMQTGRTANSKISMPGKLTIEGEDEIDE